MNKAYFPAETLDDLMRDVIEAIQAEGDPIHPTKGWAVELTGVLLELTAPRARLSCTETRGKPYSCLGELCWYLAKSNDLGFISYYIPDYRKYANGDRIFGGYGPRLFNWAGLNQLASVIDILGNRCDSRKAVIQLFDRHDIVADYEDVPCTCTMQFMRRGDKLHVLTNMRSNDVYKGLPHDVFCFTMLQEIVARALSVDVGTYKHAVGSLHLYIDDFAIAKRFLGEGFQPTIDVAMPSMPTGDPWPAIEVLLKAEAAIRSVGVLEDDISRTVDPYWGDLVRLLQVFGYKKRKARDGIEELRGCMASTVYLPFIDKILGEQH